MRLYPPLLLPIYIFLFAIVVFLPLGMMLVDSIWSQGFTVDAYATLLNPRYLATGVNSLMIASCVTMAAIVIGTIQAYMIERVFTRSYKLLVVAFVLPLLIPPYIHAIVWVFCLGPTGLVNQILTPLFPGIVPLINIYSMGGVIFVLTIAYSPVVTLCVISGLRGVNGHVEEAGLLTTTPVKILYKIVLPLLWPHILCGGLFVFVFAIINFGVADLMRVRVYPTEIFIQFSAFYNIRAATALSLPLVILTFMIVVIVQRLMIKKSIITITGEKQFTQLHHPATPPWMPALAFFLALWFCISTVVPMGVLFVKTSSYHVFFEVLRTSGAEILYSFGLAAGSAVMLVLFSLGWAYLMERSRRWGKILDILSLLPLAVPGTVLGIGMIIVWNHSLTQWIYGSSIILLIAYLAHFLPFTIRIIAANLKQIDIELEEIAHIQSPSWFLIIRKILLPLLRPSIFVSFFLGFVLCLGDLSTTLMVMPPGRGTITLKIYNLLHYGADQMVAALCLLVVFIVISLTVIFYMVYLHMED